MTETARPLSRYPRPAVVDAHLAALEVELREPGAGLLWRKHLYLRPASAQVLHAGMHRVSRLEAVEHPQAAGLVVEAIAGPPLPVPPQVRGPLHQLDVGVVVAGIPRAAYGLGDIGRRGVLVWRRALVEYGHRVPPWERSSIAAASPNTPAPTTPIFISSPRFRRLRRG